MDRTNEIITTIHKIKQLKMKLRSLVIDLTEDKPASSYSQSKSPSYSPTYYRRKVKYQQVSPKQYIHFTPKQDEMIMSKDYKPKVLASLFGRPVRSIYVRKMKLKKRAK